MPVNRPNRADGGKLRTGGDPFQPRAAVDPVSPESASADDRMKSLGARAWRALAISAVVMALLIFGAAGTLRYWQAWAYLAAFFAAATIVTLYLVENDPALLERRMSGGPTAEKEPTQKVIMSLVMISFVALCVVPALDHRFAWSTVPANLILVGDVLVVLGFYLVFLVYRENSFTSATVEVTAGQEVISSGPYAIVRHPMYAGSLPLLAGTPLALGSYWGLLAFGAILPGLIWRLLDEERFLTRNLPGYAEYCGKVRSRLIPGIF
jgi:protein-S-isoprenylcysteine O-methyltransferase Ste14